MYPIALADEAVAYDNFYSDIMAHNTAAYLRSPLTFGTHDIEHTEAMMRRYQGVSNQEVMMGNLDELIAPEISRLWFHTWISTSIQGLSHINEEACHTLEIENFYFSHETPSSIFAEYLPLYPREAGSITNHRGERHDFELSYRQVSFYQDPATPHYPNLPEAQRAEIRDLIYTWLELMSSLRNL